MKIKLHMVVDWIDLLDALGRRCMRRVLGVVGVGGLMSWNRGGEQSLVFGLLLIGCSKSTIA